LASNKFNAYGVDLTNSELIFDSRENLNTKSPLYSIASTKLKFTLKVEFNLILQFKEKEVVIDIDNIDKKLFSYISEYLPSSWGVNAFDEVAITFNFLFSLYHR
jgi:hypothetical protein